MISPPKLIPCNSDCSQTFGFVFSNSDDSIGIKDIGLLRTVNKSQKGTLEAIYLGLDMHIHNHDTRQNRDLQESSLQCMNFFPLVFFNKMTPECWESGTSYVSLMAGFIEDLYTLFGNSLGNHLVDPQLVWHSWQNSDQ